MIGKPFCRTARPPSPRDPASLPPIGGAGRPLEPPVLTSSGRKSPRRPHSPRGLLAGRDDNAVSAGGPAATVSADSVRSLLGNNIYNPPALRRWALSCVSVSVSDRVRVGTVATSTTRHDPLELEVARLKEGGFCPVIIHKFDYVFAENGTVQYKDGKLISKQAIQNQLGEELLQDLINFCLRYMGLLKLPKKRPICSLSPPPPQREKIREKFVATLQKEFAGKGLRFTRGESPRKPPSDSRSRGKSPPTPPPQPRSSLHFQLSGFCKRKSKISQLQKEPGGSGFELAPCQLSPCLKPASSLPQGGNDYEIFNDPRTIGFTVYSPTDTARLCRELFFSTPPAAPPAGTGVGGREGAWRFYHPHGET
nr:PREDICTED: phosphomannomutase 1 [Lepisosteus oculatus]